MGIRWKPDRSLAQNEGVSAGIGANVPHGKAEAGRKEDGENAARQQKWEIGLNTGLVEEDQRAMTSWGGLGKVEAGCAVDADERKCVWDGVDEERV